jgi:hypothetical protein
MSPYFTIRTPGEFNKEMDIHNEIMPRRHMQTAFTLLCESADKEYKTADGAGSFIGDVVDAAIMSLRRGWVKEYRAKLLRRTEHRPLCRATMNAFLSFYISTASDLFDWKGDQGGGSCQSSMVTPVNGSRGWFTRCQKQCQDLRVCKMTKNLERYNWYMSGCAGQWRYGDLEEAAYAGYETERAAIVFLCEVQDYLIATAVKDNSKPAWRERLHRRAKAHGCEVELAQIIADFRIEWNIHARFANESIDEFEFNQRGKM